MLGSRSEREKVEGSVGTQYVSNVFGRTEKF